MGFMAKTHPQGFQPAEDFGAIGARPRPPRPLLVGFRV